VHSLGLLGDLSELSLVSDSEKGAADRRQGARDKGEDMANTGAGAFGTPIIDDQMSDAGYPGNDEKKGAPSVKARSKVWSRSLLSL
jgi:hypothetical protein